MNKMKALPIIYIGSKDENRGKGGGEMKRGGERGRDLSTGHCE